MVNVFSFKIVFMSLRFPHESTLCKEFYFLLLDLLRFISFEKKLLNDPCFLSADG